MTANTTDAGAPPDFDGEKPDGWTSNRWLSAVALHNGATQAEAAELIGVTRSTVQGYLRDWRSQWGPDFLPANQERIKKARQAAGIEGARSTHRKYREIREQTAAEVGEVALRLNGIVDQFMQLEDLPKRVEDMTFEDLERVVRMVERLAKVAAILGGGNDPGPGPGGGPGGGPAGVLDALETKPGQHSKIYEKLEIVYGRYRQETGRDVIEAKVID